jgi:hypothetical protein
MEINRNQQEERLKKMFKHIENDILLNDQWVIEKITRGREY